MSAYSYEKQLNVQNHLEEYDYGRQGLCINPTIGIIMPLYNAAKTLPASLDGILNQSYTNWKLFIIDDYSTDSYAIPDDKRISVTKLDKNIGPSEARNLALKMISDEGLEYIALCDSDDIWISLDHLKENLTFLVATEGDICYSDVECVFEDGSPAFLHVDNKRITFYDDMNYNALLEYNWIYTSTILMRNLGLKFDKSLDGIEDWDYWLQVLENGYSMYHLNRKHTRYLVKTTNSVATWADKSKHEKIKIRQITAPPTAKIMLRNLLSL
jgi:glycosyltransferase involved in cell wall biosynthesis